ncbi:hypothetical protein [Rhizobium sp. SG741]|uniref:hypothetical protein n=1 Tax=Rhizobium sp. SG741 TaxID=2587114 RepID=UPI00104EADBA|nr:hypothetical protein [Rhizobium sp. SG741]NKJ03737.1 hypothetical protein [Rhizobium sp. SG741]
MPTTNTTIAENALREQSLLHVSKVATSDVLDGSDPLAVGFAARSVVVCRRPSNSDFAILAQRD